MAHKNRMKTDRSPAESAPLTRHSAGTAMAAAPVETSSPRAGVDHEEVARRAYQYWQERGCPDGCPEEDWFRAESELRRRGQA